MSSTKVSFNNNRGNKLSGIIEFPLHQKPTVYALFAHVFTGNKSLSATRNITKALTQQGVAVLRFDFSGLGQSEGKFEDTNFSTNVEDMLSAANFLKENYREPSLVVGHSLGGAAAIETASRLDSVVAVATIGTPSEPKHVMHLLSCNMDEIMEKGESIVNIGGADVTIKKQFVEDLSNHKLSETLADFDKAMLIMHSPQDTVVEIENAAKIYHTAKHPKSFITLDNADHMLTNKQDALYAGNVIATWMRRYIDVEEEEKLTTDKQVIARLGDDGFTTDIMAGGHPILADEPKSAGGDDLGASPYELLNASLGACTAMTLQMYARRKNWPLEEVRVHLNYSKSHIQDSIEYKDPNTRIDHFERLVEVEGDLSQEQLERLLEIADKCPIHKTLSTPNFFKTTVKLVK